MTTLSRIVLLALVCLEVARCAGISHATGGLAGVDSLADRADSFLARGDLNSAESAFQQLISLGKVERGMIGLGKIALIQEKWNEARSRFGSALEADSASKEVRYYLAVSFRESGRWRIALDPARVQGISQQKAYLEAHEHFRWILEHDSAYKDVLYQYALLLKDEAKFGSAMASLCAQLEVKRNAVIAWSGIQRLLRAAYQEGRISELLQAVPPDFEDVREYLNAEILLRKGQLHDAESVLRSLAVKSNLVPLQLTSLSLVRIYAKRNNTRILETTYWKAVDSITDEVGGFLLFEDLKYFLSPAEVYEYLRSTSPAMRISVLRAIWNKRNPLQGLPTNQRLVEHYMRLIFAEEHYYLDRERYSYFYEKGRPGLDFDLNDAGLVYMRHGKPDEIQEITQEGKSVIWLYRPTETEDQMMFQFYGAEMAFSGGGSTAAPRPMQAKENYRSFVTPPPPLEVPENNNVLESKPFQPIRLPSDLIFSDPDYFYIWKGMIEGSEFERHRAAERIRMRAGESISKGLTSDRAEVDRSMKYLELSSMLSTFRDGVGKTMLDISYVIPTSMLLKEMGDSVQTVALATGVAVYDRYWKKVVGAAETLKVSRSSTGSGSLMRFHQVFVTPDSYYVAINAQPVGGKVTGRSERRVSAADYWQSNMALSDLELALDIRRDDKSSVFDKGGLIVEMSPTRIHMRNKPLYLYFEIYGSTRSGGRPAPGLDVNIRSKESQGGLLTNILKLFREKKGYFVASEGERWSSEDVLAKYLAIDVTRLEPGDYVIEVTINDKITERTLSKSLDIEIVGSDTAK